MSLIKLHLKLYMLSIFSYFIAKDVDIKVVSFI